MDRTLLYALIVYCFYHLEAESDIMARPRAWWTRVLPSGVTYALSCAFCLTTWCSIALTIITRATTGYWLIDLDLLCAAPVINLIISALLTHLRGPKTPTTP